jgi:hypothetical protein
MNKQHCLLTEINIVIFACMQKLILLLLLTTNQEGLNPKRRMIRLEI